MKILAKNLYFWVATVLLLVITTVAALWFLPPLLNQLQTNRNELATLKTDVAANEQFLATIQGIEKQTTTLQSLNEKATLSLPKDTQPEILMLQLEGLLEALNLGGIKIDAPLSAPATGASGEVQQVTKFTLTGDMSFAQAKELIVRLRGLSRWNKLTAIDLSQSESRTTVTIAGEAYSKPGSPKNFTGSPSFLADAKTLFDSLTPYTTIPDVKTEGSFGKNDPFN